MTRTKRSLCTHTTLHLAGHRLHSRSPLFDSDKFLQFCVACFQHIGRRREAFTPCSSCKLLAHLNSNDDCFRSLLLPREEEEVQSHLFHLHSLFLSKSPFRAYYTSIIIRLSLTTFFTNDRQATTLTKFLLGSTVFHRFIHTFIPAIQATPVKQSRHNTIHTL